MFHIDTQVSGSPTHGSAGLPDSSDPTEVHGLDALLNCTAEELQALYLAARAPNLADVRGDLRGRMLANVLFGGPLAAALATFAGTGTFPWRGKSFAPCSLDAGEGINRIVVDRFRQFPFSTFIGPSRAGDFDALQLDYDRAENPWFIRKIKDEIRELQPGLYLGQAYLDGSPARLVLYFGLTSNVDAPASGGVGVRA